VSADVLNVVTGLLLIVSVLAPNLLAVARRAWARRSPPGQVPA
jgi:hypothetical protein